MAAPGTATGSGTMRDFREELIALMESELILSAAVARECELSLAELEDWLAGSERSLVARRVEEFLDARASVWEKIAAADNQSREVIARQFISNAAGLINEMMQAPRATREEIHDHIRLQFGDLRRIIALMASEQSQSPERTAEAIRAALRPGDRMIIARAGGNENPRTKAAD
jgi:hypothetical protein